MPFEGPEQPAMVNEPDPKPKSEQLGKGSDDDKRSPSVEPTRTTPEANKGRSSVRHPSPPPERKPDDSALGVSRQKQEPPADVRNMGQSHHEAHQRQPVAVPLPFPQMFTVLVAVLAILAALYWYGRPRQAERRQFNGAAVANSKSFGANWHLPLFFEEVYMSANGQPGTTQGKRDKAVVVHLLGNRMTDLVKATNTVARQVCGAGAAKRLSGGLKSFDEAAKVLRESPCTVLYADSKGNNTAFTDKVRDIINVNAATFHFGSHLDVPVSHLSFFLLTEHPDINRSVFDVPEQPVRPFDIYKHSERVGFEYPRKLGVKVWESRDDKTAMTTVYFSE